jgi:ABC-type sugar transport system substrate-binding protein
MKHMFWMKAGVLLLVLGHAVAGCRSAEEASSNGAKTLRLAFVTNNSADFWTIARRGVEKADAELADVEVDFRLTPPPEAAEQQRIVDDLLTGGWTRSPFHRWTPRTRRG